MAPAPTRPKRIFLLLDLVSELVSGVMNGIRDEIYVGFHVVFVPRRNQNFLQRLHGQREARFFVSQNFRPSESEGKTAVPKSLLFLKNLARESWLLNVSGHTGNLAHLQL